MKRLVIIKGGGEIATGTAIYLFRAGFRVLLLETERPSSIRREVSFADAAYDGKKTVERVTCRLVSDIDAAQKRLKDNEVVMLIDPSGKSIRELKPKYIVDAVFSGDKRSLDRSLAEHTLALGPGFCAGRDVDAVIETMRGYNLGRIVYEGYSSRKSGQPGQVAADDHIEHILFSPAAGEVEALHHISYPIKEGEAIAVIHAANGKDVTATAQMTGVIRGIIRDGFPIREGQKLADINPTMRQGDCFRMSDKSRCIAGAVLEAIMIWDSQKKKRGFFDKLSD